MWTERESEKWHQVEQRIEELVTSAQPLTEDTVFFIYSASDPIASAAMRETMHQLEKRHVIVVAIRLEDTDAIAASIATTNEDTDLRAAFTKLHQTQGVTAGGRPNVGGAQFPPNISLDQAITILANALSSTQTRVIRTKE